MNNLRSFILFLASFLSLVLQGGIVAGENNDTSRADRSADAGVIRILHNKKLPATIPCERIPVGGRMGYKPNMVKLSNGELLMANFHTHYETQSDGSMCDHAVLHRSSDNGKNWTSKHYDHLPGKEPYLNVLGDVLIMTAHIYPPDIHAIPGRTTAWLHRSEDGGHTWKSQVLDIDRIPEKVDLTYSSRNIIELDDGSFALGIGCGMGRDYLFLSQDKGITWNPKKIQVSGFDNRSYRYSILQEGIFFRTETGRLLLLARCELPKLKNLDKNLPGLPKFGSIGAIHEPDTLGPPRPSPGGPTHPLPVVATTGFLCPSSTKAWQADTLELCRPLKLMPDANRARQWVGSCRSEKDRGLAPRR